MTTVHSHAWLHIDFCAVAKAAQNIIDRQIVVLKFHIVCVILTLYDGFDCEATYISISLYPTMCCGSHSETYNNLARKIIDDSIVSLSSWSCEKI